MNPLTDRFRSLGLYAGLLILLSYVSKAQPGNSASKPNQVHTPDQIARLLLTKLKSIKSVNYDYYRDVNYVSENYQNSLSGTTYLDFKSSDNVLGLRFQFLSDKYKTIYNGKNLLLLEEESKKLTVDKQPKINDFSSLSFFVNSFITLKNSLNEIISSKDISKALSDTAIDEKMYHLLTFKLNSKTIRNLGAISQLTVQRDIIYKVVIDKNDYLPYQVIQTNNATPRDYVLTKFSNYKVNNYMPAESTWQYLSYVNDYKPLIRN
jgi:hypothetical protein